jgi:hypothetical protein
MAYFIRQGIRVSHIESQLHCGADFVDILTSGSGSQDKIQLNVIFINE